MKFGKKAKKKVEVEQNVEPAPLKCSNICSKTLDRFVVRGSNEQAFKLSVSPVEQRQTMPYSHLLYEGIVIRSRDECNDLIDALTEVAEIIS